MKYEYVTYIKYLLPISLKMFLFQCQLLTISRVGKTKFNIEMNRKIAVLILLVELGTPACGLGMTVAINRTCTASSN